MNRSIAAAIAISLLAFACAKEKKPQVSNPGAALSNNDQCAMLNCQKPNNTATQTATVTATSTSTSTGTDTNPPTPPPPQEEPSLNDTQKMAMNVQLNCRGGDCNPSVGLLSITLKDAANNWNAGQCTASLIAPDVLVTNGHCIPNDLEAAGSSCKNRLWITFADDPSHPELDKQIGCDKVLLRHKDGGLDGSDYAYLKLQKASNRPALRQTQDGFENEKAYHLHKINPARVANGIGGQFMKVDCRSIYESAIFSAPLDKLSPTNLFVDCEVIPGNSGSPILADDGSVRGVIYAFVRKEAIRQVFDRNGSVVPPIAEIADLNVGSNFACLTLPGDNDGAQLPAPCGDSLERLAKKKAAAQAERVKLLRPAAQQLIGDHAEQRADILAFGWTLSTADGETTGTTAIGVPECVREANVASLLGQETKIHRPFFSVRADYDKYLRASNLGPVWGGFATNPENMTLKRGEDASYQLDIADQDSGQVEFNSSLAACTAQQNASMLVHTTRSVRATHSVRGQHKRGR